ncbi:MAG: P1 family peptidase [Eubacteriales bacterium]|nr:P1 family peptidase [Eubacteriales bacterium]
MAGKRIRDFGIQPGRVKTGARNKITDVPGVLVGHCTVRNETNHTGVTVIVPGKDNCFSKKYTAAAYVHNGFGKSAGLVQIEELGTLETPIALTNTMNTGLVWDALAEHVMERCRQDGIEALSVNPVVGECNDSRINRIQKRAVFAEHVEQAFAAAAEDFEEGGVGAGAGTVCYGMKGGIGSSSRIVEIGGRSYTIGVLVQSNFGATEDFVLDGKPVGARILELKKEKDDMAASAQDQGSIMTVLATDLPVTSRQLKRIIRRLGVGIARTGSYTGHGSGEVMIGFTTANRIPADGGEELLELQAIPETVINRAFLAAAEAAQEAILNSMAAAEPVRGLKGEMYYSLSEFLPLLSDR